MMRAIALAVLALYPKVWRDRYGEEVADLVRSRPARPRTVLDLARGAADAWAHRRRLPGAAPPRVRAAGLPVVLTAVLAAGGAFLWLLWNPGLRDQAGLHGVWAAAAAGGFAAGLPDAARWLFAAAGVQAVLAALPLVLASRAVMTSPGQGQVARLTAGRVLVTAVLVAVPVALFGHLFHGAAFARDGYPAGPLGEAMAGGFLVPVVLALVLPLPAIAAPVPALAAVVRTCGASLAVAAILNALAWLPVAALMALGLAKAPGAFAAAVSAGALVSVAMGALVAVIALGHRRAVPELQEIYIRPQP
ncbi:hypothetical protein [Nonomuraea sp. NPDC003214]